MNLNDSQQFDNQHIWHPYSALNSDLPAYPVQSANGTRLTLSDGRELVDGMSSWWCVIHGYNHPKLNMAIEQQLKHVAHVMFGGLTHEPAITLAQKLIDITPAELETVFFSDSGSVAVEVAMKMAIQYWQSKQYPDKQAFISLRGAYHGDTFGVMSVCDPVTGMHSLFQNALAQQFFVERPESRFNNPCSERDIANLTSILERHADKTAALIMEPIVQGAGGMWFYSAEFLSRARELCHQYDVLLILDEIATGFGRTGKLFACEHADVSPDIMCVGKALTGGYLSLAATLTTKEVADTIDQGEPGVFMHGPTFMANPLACAAGVSSLQLLLESDWQQNIQRIEAGLLKGLSPCQNLASVNDVRVLGAIGVVELHQPVNMKDITEAFVNNGVWIRPFGKLVYLMPPYIISDDEIDTLTSVIFRVLGELE